MDPWLLSPQVKVKVKSKVKGGVKGGVKGKVRVSARQRESEQATVINETKKKELGISKDKVETDAG